MTLAEIARKPGAFDNNRIALENAAVTRLLEAEGILDYSGHVSTRIPGRDAFVIQIGSTSRAEVTPDSMLVVDYDGKVLEGEGQTPRSRRSSAWKCVTGTSRSSGTITFARP